LQQLKTDLHRLEMEIAFKIQENQMKQNQGESGQAIDKKETAPVIPMNTKEEVQLKVVAVNGLAGKRNEGKEYPAMNNGIKPARIKRANRLRL
jgi:hypothetical protein